MPDSPAKPRLIVGCMTGTSLDALDAALVEVTGRDLSRRAHMIEHADRPLGDLAHRLRALAEQKAMTAGDIASLALDFGNFHAEAIESLLAGRRADLIVLHGQTVFHSPPASWQMVNPWPIAERTRTTVVYDLRGADLASGGQGAPITPIADWVLFRADHPRAIINLGGFCNITLLPCAPKEAASESAKTRMLEPLAHISGMDVCACNHILDLVAQRAFDKPFDENGAAASIGAHDESAATALAALLRTQSNLKRSLGTGDESARWVNDHIAALKPNDLAATAVDGLARAIAASIPAACEPIIAGGGAKNLALTHRLAAHLKREVLTTADLGIPIHAREAVCMAVLGALAQDRVPITLPRVTGRRESAPISGAWIHP